MAQLVQGRARQRQQLRQFMDSFVHSTVAFGTTPSPRAFLEASARASDLITATVDPTATEAIFNAWEKGGQSISYLQRSHAAKGGGGAGSASGGGGGGGRAALPAPVAGQGSAVVGTSYPKQFGLRVPVSKAVIGNIGRRDFPGTCMVCQVVGHMQRECPVRMGREFGESCPGYDLSGGRVSVDWASATP